MKKKLKLVDSETMVYIPESDTFSTNSFVGVVLVVDVVDSEDVVFGLTQGRSDSSKRMKWGNQQNTNTCQILS